MKKAYNKPAVKVFHVKSHEILATSDSQQSGPKTLSVDNDGYQGWGD